MIFFRMAIEQGADYIECDVEVTKDLKLVCSHEPWISEVVDMTQWPDNFKDRKTKWLKKAKVLPTRQCCQSLRKARNRLELHLIKRNPKRRLARPSLTSKKFKKCTRLRLTSPKSNYMRTLGVACGQTLSWSLHWPRRSTWMLLTFIM